MLQFEINLMTINHYDEVYQLWKSVYGICLGKSDTKESITKFLERNEGLSFVAIKDNKVIGVILGSNDGRRGYIHHLAVDNKFQNKGIGKALVLKCLSKFREIGLYKTHVFVFPDNDNAIKFWNKMGYKLRKDILMMSKDIE